VIRSRAARTRPLPRAFLDWQVALRLHTMRERHGEPHVGVAPLVAVKRAGMNAGVAVHSVICGLLPRPELLEKKTLELRELYETGIAEGARAVYDRGIAYLHRYYESSEAFDAESITTLLHRDTPVVQALRAQPSCALVFYVFDLADKSELGRFRCLQIDAEAEVLERGPVFDNVWWHNTLFHGKADESVVVHFRHVATWDTRFGALQALVP
jgi:hypothetical protein